MTDDEEKLHSMLNDLPNSTDQELLEYLSDIGFSFEEMQNRWSE